MNTILKIEPYKQKMRIYFEQNPDILLYKGEIKKYHLSEGMLVDDALISELMQVLYLRARERALYLLDRSYKTEKEVRDKLKAGLYPDAIIEQVVAYLKEFLLLDDMRYATMYIEYKCNTKSKKQITQDLLRKGIDKETINEALEQTGISDEQSLEQIVRKRLYKYDMKDIKSVQKFYQYLVGKGYQYHEVKRILSQYTTFER